jgi:hypothetical protein
MTENKSSQRGPTFLLSEEEKKLQQKIRDGEAQPSATPEAGTFGTKE